jgi:hypothetical protein
MSLISYYRFTAGLSNLYACAWAAQRLGGLYFRQPMAVCAACDAAGCPKQSHFWAFRLPQLLGYHHDLPCVPPSELGRNHALLPVTHVGGERAAILSLSRGPHHPATAMTCACAARA